MPLSKISNSGNITNLECAKDAVWATTIRQVVPVSIFLKIWSLGNCPKAWVLSSEDIRTNSGRYLYFMYEANCYWCQMDQNLMY